MRSSSAQSRRSDWPSDRLEAHARHQAGRTFSRCCRSPKTQRSVLAGAGFDGQRLAAPGIASRGWPVRRCAQGCKRLVGVWSRLPTNAPTRTGPQGRFFVARNPASLRDFGPFCRCQAAHDVARNSPSSTLLCSLFSTCPYQPVVVGTRRIPDAARSYAGVAKSGWQRRLEQQSG